MKPGLRLLAFLVGWVALAAYADEGRTPKPQVVIEKPGKCIAPADVMRRTHMDLLKHQRVETVHEGVRGAQVSLNGCISCHASSKNGAVIGTSENFCQSCHAFVAVKLDCFECHQPKAPTPAAQASAADRPAATESKR